MPNPLLTGISGLRSHQKMLEVIGNNLANVDTTAFKSSRVLFSDMFYDTASAGTSANSGVIGSVNPIQYGTGTQISQVDHNFTQGNLEQTGEELDMAIVGNGFFVLQGGGYTYYSRAGALTLTADGTLVDAGSGFQVRRTGTLGDPGTTPVAFQTAGEDTITIPKGAAIPGEPSATISIGGNMPANTTGPIAEVIRMSAGLQSGAAAATAATTLNSLDSNLVNYIPGDRILITGNDHDGAPVSASYTIAAGSTVGDLLSAVDTAFTQSTATLDAQGRIQLDAPATGPSQLNLTLTDAPGNTGNSRFLDHNLIDIAVGKDPDSFTRSMEVFDERGFAHSVDYVLTKQADSTWNLTASIPAADGTMLDNVVTGIQFNNDGSFAQVSGTGVNDGNLIFQFNNSSAPQTIAVDFGTSGTFEGLTEIGVHNTLQGSADGFEPSTLTSVQVDGDGTLYGVTSSGFRMPMAQLAVASFTNNDGLLNAGNNMFEASLSSGDPSVGAAGADGRGSILSRQLEASNVDMATEFTKLIIAQRGFSANARTITVTDEMMQELTNLIR